MVKLNARDAHWRIIPTDALLVGSARLARSSEKIKSATLLCLTMKIIRSPDITQAGRPGLTPSTLIAKLEATPTRDRITVVDVSPESSIVELTADTPHKSTTNAAVYKGKRIRMRSFRVLSLKLSCRLIASIPIELGGSFGSRHQGRFNSMRRRLQGKLLGR
jgi:hypothetical protein